MLKNNLRIVVAATLALVLAAPVVLADTDGSTTTHHSKTSSRASAEKSTSTAPVDINTADAKQFATLKRIGTKKAAAIVAYRKEHGAFTSINDLTKVKGVSQAIIDANKDRLKMSAD
jgi:competence protein ComEA